MMVEHQRVRPEGRKSACHTKDFRKSTPRQNQVHYDVSYNCEAYGCQFFFCVFLFYFLLYLCMGCLKGMPKGKGPY